MTELPFNQLGAFRSPSSALEGDAVSAPTEEELARPIVAPGSDALLPYAVEYQAPWDVLEDGLARHSREQVRALSKAGLPVVLRRLNRPKFVMEDEVSQSVTRAVGYLRDTSAGSIPVAIRQLVVHSASYLESVIAPAGARLSGFSNEMKVYQSTIVYTPWERTTVAPDVVAVLNRCAEVWVHGEWVVEIFKRAGVEDVYAIPAPYDPDTNPACQISAPRGSERVPDGKRFYAIGKWEPRKNYDALLGAFLLEFAPTEKASLFLKTHEWGAWENYPTVDESVSRWLLHPEVVAKGWNLETFGRRVRIVSKKLPEEQITKLHRDNNIYVSCSHAEGWDLPAFDARCAGNRLVYTGWGGPTDFAGEEDMKYHEEPLFCDVHPGYGWESGAQWADLPIIAIRRSLRHAAPPARRVHPPEFYRKFGIATVGAMMAARIKERFPVAYEKLVKAGGFG